MSQNLVDLHCHILPGIDDGAKNLTASMALLHKEVQDGVAGIVFTPHFHYERISVEEFAAQRRAAFVSVAKACRREGLPLAAKMGAEVYFTTALPGLDLSVLAFAKSNYILIEFPTTCHPAGIDETLFAVRQQGYTPILAHVERYPFVTEDPTLLYNWVSAGCLAQINAAGLLREGRTAHWLQKLMDWNLVHLLSTDAHSMETRPPNLRAGYGKLPPKIARRMRRNSIEVYLGNEFSVPEPSKPQYRFGHWA